jgi:predicted dehydrogenase
MDVGCYPVSWLRWFGGEPQSLAATATLENGVDVHCAGSLQFSSGLVGSFVTSVQCVQPNCNTFYAERGSLTIHEPWRNPPGAPLIVRTAAGEQTYAAEDTGLPIHALEALHVQAHIPTLQAPGMTWEDSRGQQRTLDLLRRQIGVKWIGES